MEPGLLCGLDVVRPVDVEYQGQDDAIDRAAFVDQPFEIVAQTRRSARMASRSLDAPEANRVPAVTWLP